MDPATGRSLEAGRTLGHYRLQERIGAGGMGEVWRARDERLERDVALKVLLPGMITDDSARKRFRREALALSKLSHPNIATVFDFASEAGHDYLVMEYVGGATLGAHRGEDPLAEAEVVRLGLQLAEGLAAAHGEGIVHRDLKPANVRLTVDGRLKILDFGLAHLARPAGDGAGSAAPTQSASMTEAGALVGTLGYMAPEQVRGEKADARADLWAAGLVLYELVTGRAAYAQAETAPLLHAILNESVALPRKANPRVSTALEAIILKCVEKEPAKRYGSARELAEDLARLQGGLSVAAERSRAHTRRLRTLAVAGPIAVVVLLVALAALDVGGIRTRLFAPSPIRSIAVLPLANLSGDPGQEYFADGMTEQLINDLGQVSALRVISRTTAMQYKGAKKGLKEIAKELNVEAIVEGSVARSGDRVRISAQLIRAKEDRQLWAQSFERDLRDVLAMQGEMAGMIAGALSARLAPDDRARLARSGPVDRRAYELYLMGKAFSGRKALEYYRQAVAVDSGFALAYIGIADACTHMGWVGEDVAPGIGVLKRAAVRKALELDERLAEAHRVAAEVLCEDWKWTDAETEYRRALELNPNSEAVHGSYGFFLTGQGRYDEAAAELERQQDLKIDPPKVFDLCNDAFSFYYARRFDLAVALLRKAQELDPSSRHPNFVLSFCLLEQGAVDEAYAEAKKALGDQPPSFVPVVSGCGYVFGRAGRRQEALAMVDRLRVLLPNGADPYSFAWTWGGIGEVDSTLTWLERAYAGRGIGYIKQEFWPRALRADPRFKELLRKIGLPPD